MYEEAYVLVPIASNINTVDLVEASVTHRIMIIMKLICL